MSSFCIYDEHVSRGSEDMRHLVASLTGSVVKVICRDLNQSGTGFFVAADGLLVTCCHVVSRERFDSAGAIVLDYSQDIWLQLPTGGWQQASIVHRIDSTRPWWEDYAILQTNVVASSSVNLGSLDLVEPGDGVIMLGFPLETEHVSATFGRVSAKHRSPSHVNALVNLNMIQIDGAVNMGNSGGPLIDAHTGAVVGIVSLRMGSIERRLARLRAMLQVGSHSPIVEETIGTLEDVQRYLNPGLGQAISIEYAHRELQEQHLI